MFKSKKGFTLIELLVVIAIIGILASVVLASLNSARKKSRDARRIADVKQVQLAEEMYFDTLRSYASALTGLAPTYIPAIPVAPSPGSYAYAAVDSAGGACDGTAADPCMNYVIQVQLEEETNPALASDVDGTVLTLNCADNGGVSPDTNRYYCARP